MSVTPIQPSAAVNSGSNTFSTAFATFVWTIALESKSKAYKIKITADKGFKNIGKNNAWQHDKNSFEFRSIFHSNDKDYLAKIEECNNKEKDSSRYTKNKTNVGDDFKNRLLNLAKQLWTEYGLLNKMKITWLNFILADWFKK